MGKFFNFYNWNHLGNDLNAVDFTIFWKNKMTQIEKDLKIIQEKYFLLKENFNIENFLWIFDALFF